MSHIVAIYTDGATIGNNPSKLGGAWAWCAVDIHNDMIANDSGIVYAPKTRIVTNNQIEQIAIVKALEAMPEGWSGIIYSDSMIAMGRVFKGFGKNPTNKNLPPNIIRRTLEAVARCGKLTAIHVKGHSGNIYNEWCDEECSRLVRVARRNITARSHPILVRAAQVA